MLSRHHLASRDVCLFSKIRNFQHQVPSWNIALYCFGVGAYIAPLWHDRNIDVVTRLLRQVAMAARRLERLNELVEELRHEGVADVCAVRMDVCDEASIKAGVKQVDSFTVHNLSVVYNRRRDNVIRHWHASPPDPTQP